MNSLLSVEEVSELIHAGLPLCLAGTDALLARLPAGNWIGGTIPYFMTEEGGCLSLDRVFVSRLPGAAHVTSAVYGAEAIAQLIHDAPADGFTVVIAPAATEALRRFAEDGRKSPDLFLKPIVGWAAGVNLDAPGDQPAVYFGTDRSRHRDAIVALHVTLPTGRLASIEIVNIFHAAEQEVVEFAETGFTARYCSVNGVRRPLAEYLRAAGNADGRRPLMGNYTGADVNVAIKSIDPATGDVAFFGPVFPGVQYRLAKPIKDYETAFAEGLARCDQTSVVFSCNCVLNYLYGNLEGRKTGLVVGPMTFGEIGYQLLTQTCVLLHVH